MPAPKRHYKCCVLGCTSEHKSYSGFQNTFLKELCKANVDKATILSACFH